MRRRHKNINKNINKDNLLYKILNLQFRKKNHNILKLEEWNELDLYYYLKNIGFDDEALIFFNENVDGKTFIILFTEIACKSIFYELELNDKQIYKLSELYYIIYRYRKIFITNIDGSETPIYYTSHYKSYFNKY